jgi:hypothetical protein
MKNQGFIASRFFREQFVFSNFAIPCLNSTISALMSRKNQPGGLSWVPPRSLTSQIYLRLRLEIL